MNLFTMLPVSSGVAGLPTIPASDIRYLETLEDAAYEHWIFDAGSDSLTGRVNGRALTKQAENANNPSWQSNHMSLLRSVGNGLLTDMTDRADMTMCFVVRNFTSAGVVILGGTRGDAGTPGSFLMTSAGTLQANQTPSGQVGPLAVQAGWNFVAYSESSTNNTRLLLSGELNATRATTPAKTVSTSRVVIGDGYYSAESPAGSSDFAEAILFDRALSLADLQAVYARSKERMALRGVLVE